MSECKYCRAASGKINNTFANEVTSESPDPIDICSFSHTLMTYDENSKAILSTNFAVSMEGDPQGIISYVANTAINYCPICGRLLHKGQIVEEPVTNMSVRYVNLGGTKED